MKRVLKCTTSSNVELLLLLFASSMEIICHNPQCILIKTINCLNPKDSHLNRHKIEMRSLLKEEQDIVSEVKLLISLLIKCFIQLHNSKTTPSCIHGNSYINDHVSSCGMATSKPSRGIACM